MQIVESSTINNRMDRCRVRVMDDGPEYDGNSIVVLQELITVSGPCGRNSGLRTTKTPYRQIFPNKDPANSPSVSL